MIIGLDFREGWTCWWERRLTGTSDEDADNESVHTENTSHDDGDNRFEKELRLEDSDGNNTDTGLGSSVSSTQVGEHEGGDNTHGSKEESLVGVTEV